MQIAQIFEQDPRFPTESDDEERRDFVVVWSDALLSKVCPQPGYYLFILYLLKVISCRNFEMESKIYSIIFPHALLVDYDLTIYIRALNSQSISIPQWKIGPQ